MVLPYRRPVPILVAVSSQVTFCYDTTCALLSQIMHNLSWELSKDCVFLLCKCSSINMACSLQQGQSKGMHSCPKGQNISAYIQAFVLCLHLRGQSSSMKKTDFRNIPLKEAVIWSTFYYLLEASFGLYKSFSGTNGAYQGLGEVGKGVSTSRGQRLSLGR